MSPLALSLALLPPQSRVAHPRVGRDTPGAVFISDFRIFSNCAAGEAPDPGRVCRVWCAARVCPDYYTGVAETQTLEPVSCSNKNARENPVTRTVNHDRTTTSEDRTPGRNLNSLGAAN